MGSYIVEARFKNYEGQFTHYFNVEADSEEEAMGILGHAIANGHIRISEDHMVTPIIEISTKNISDLKNEIENGILRRPDKEAVQKHDHIEIMAVKRP